MWIDQTSGVYYKMTVKSAMATGTLELTDTNLDVKKTIDEQVVTNGLFVKAKNSIIQDNKQTVTVSNCDGETCTATSVVKTDSTRTAKFVIKSIDGDKITTESGLKFTKDQFLAFVSYEYAKKVMEAQYKVAYGEKYYETIDTAFGKKKLTAQQMTYNDDIDGKVVQIYYFGSNDVLYKTTQDETQEMTLKGTSLIKL